MRATTEPRYLPIADYAFLGDCHSCALVSSAGSVDWACLRRFDAASTFGRLLDRDRGGHFSMTLAGRTHHERRYLEGTLVLVTDEAAAGGRIRRRDAFVMRPGGRRLPSHELVRTLDVEDGSVEILVELVPRFDYGLTRPYIRRHGPSTFDAVGGSEALVVASDQPLEVNDDGDGLTARLLLAAGESLTIVVTSQEPHALDVGLVDLEGARTRLDRTAAWWTEWSSSTVVDGEFAEVARRSAVVLKALTCALTGAVAAAPTTSLPEVAGGSANWDYRYSWVRDSSQVVDALAHVGHPEVARGFHDFLMRTAAGHASDLQILYGMFGERRLDEFELDLEGWRGSRPVRVGNLAASQVQLDVYASLLDTVHVWNDGHAALEVHERRFLRSAADLVCERWREPDQGIWELRGAPRHYVYSKAACWMALDRAIRLASLLEADDATVERWAENRHLVHEAVMADGVDPDRGNFVQSFGSSRLDASLLKLPLMGFVPAEDPAMLATVDAVSEDLGNGSGLIRRFDPDPDAVEGAFLLCSCWLSEVLAMQGRLDRARGVLRSVLCRANDVGLLAEEADMATGELLGNFPQAYTHLGVIQAARRIAGS